MGIILTCYVFTCSVLLLTPDRAQAKENGGTRETRWVQSTMDEQVPSGTADSEQLLQYFALETDRDKTNQFG